MKRILTIFLILFTFEGTCHAKNFEGIKFDIKQNRLNAFINKEIGVNYNDVSDIKSFLKELNVCANNHDIDGVKKLYSKDYISFDGFNYETFIKMIKETFKSYSDISYFSNVMKIDVIGDFATVLMFDKTRASAVDKTLALEDEGVLDGYCEYILYLKKEVDGWKIVNDFVIVEETSLKYGIARDLNIKLNAPKSVTAGADYSILLDFDSPENSFVLASLSTETASYPPQEPKEVFRKMPDSGVLERIVSANEKGLNEYAVASIGITTIDAKPNTSALRLKMSGMAFMMKRVNVFEEKNDANR